MIRKRFQFDNGRGELLSAALEQPEGDARAMALFAHCFTCSKEILTASRISRALSRKGLAVVRFDFTGLGSSEGDFTNTNFSSNIEDLIAASEHMREELQAPEVLIGHSLGGAAVLAAAKQIPESRLVAVINSPSDPSHLLRYLSEDLEDIKREGSATVTLAGRPFRIKKQLLEDLAGHKLEASIRQLKKALLVFHSPDDSIVRIENGLKIFEWAGGSKNFITLKGADHLLRDPDDAEIVANILAVWVSRYLE